MAPLLAIAALAVSRVVRRWNQTGQKLIGSPDIARSFLPFHQGLLWILVGLTYFHIGSSLVHYDLDSRHYSFMAFVIFTVLTALVFKIAFTQSDSPELLSNGHLPVWVFEFISLPSLVVQARAVFGSLLVSSGLGFLKRGVGVLGPPRYRGASNLSSVLSAQLTDHSLGMIYLMDLLSLFLVTQTRVTNIPLILIFTLQVNIIEKFNLSIDEISMSLLILQHVGFFSYGESNAISSIDLSNAYNGVSGYNAVAVGILTFVDNWAGPIWWSTRYNMLLIKSAGGNWQSFQKHVCILTIFNSLSTLAIMVACTVFRSHLFIWTVFSPKYLFGMAWIIGHHTIVDILLCAAMFQVANMANA